MIDALTDLSQAKIDQGNKKRLGCRRPKHNNHKGDFWICVKLRNPVLEDTLPVEAHTIRSSKYPSYVKNY